MVHGTIKEDPQAPCKRKAARALRPYPAWVSILLQVSMLFWFCRTWSRGRSSSSRIPSFF